MTDAHDLNEQRCPLNQPCVVDRRVAHVGQHQIDPDRLAVVHCSLCEEDCQCSLIHAVRAEERAIHEQELSDLDAQHVEELIQHYAAAVGEAIRRVRETFGSHPCTRASCKDDRCVGARKVLAALTAMKEGK